MDYIENELSCIQNVKIKPNISISISCENHNK